MSETIYITTEHDQKSASTLAQQNGGGVAVSCPVFIDKCGNLSTTKSDSTIEETQGLKLVEWHSDNDFIGSETEKTFSANGILVSPNIHVISGSFDGDIEILNKNANLDIWFIDEKSIQFYPKK